MAKKQDTDRELSLLVKELVEGTTEELKTMIPSIDLSPEIPDAKIKDAILRISPVGMEKLFAKFGQQNVLNYISEFSQGKRWG